MPTVSVMTNSHLNVNCSIVGKGIRKQQSFPVSVFQLKLLSSVRSKSGSSYIEATKLFLVMLFMNICRL